jgi:hypothetical protein
MKPPPTREYRHPQNGTGGGRRSGRRLGLSENLRRGAVLFLMCPLIAIGSVAHAAPVTFQITGAVSLVSLDDPSILRFDDSVRSGTSYSAEFTIDLQSPDLDPSSRNQGLYPLRSYRASLGAYDFAASSNAQVVVLNDLVVVNPIDHYDVIDLSPVIEGNVLLSGIPQPARGGPRLEASLSLFSQFDFNAAFLEGDALLLPDLARFPALFFFVLDFGTVRASASGYIDSLTVVPEPSTAALLTAGIALGAVSRRSRTRATLLD